MFNERISLVFKKLRVVRMVDRKRNTLVYLTYSDRVIEGSPQNSVTAVPVDRATPIPVRDRAALAATRRAHAGDAAHLGQRRPEPGGVGDLDGEGHVRGAAGAVASPSCDLTPVTLIFSLANTSETSRSSPWRSLASTCTSTG